MYKFSRPDANTLAFVVVNDVCKPRIQNVTQQWHQAVRPTAGIFTGCSAILGSARVLAIADFSRMAVRWFRRAAETCSEPRALRSNDPQIRESAH